MTTLHTRYICCCNESWPLSKQDIDSGTFYCPLCNQTKLFATHSHETVTPVKELMKERGKVYGEPHLSHKNIGLSWTGLLQQHYGIVLDHPIPDYVVELMMVAFKVHRSARVFHEDNYRDLEAYAKFAEHAQKNPGTPYPV